MSDGKLHIGFSKVDNSPIEIPVKTMRRHFAALGASGSGKTVLVKAVLEECIREDIPMLLVDIQGDLASLALMGDKKQVEEKGVPGSYYDEIKKKAQVAIFTPASNKGIPLSMNPLKAPPKDLDPADLIQSIDTVAETVASLCGYNTEKTSGKAVQSYLYKLLEAIWLKGDVELDNLDDLIELMSNDSDYLSPSISSIINEKEKDKLINNVRHLTIGADSLIFNLGMPLDIERMVSWADKGKTPINVLYLNTIRDESTRMSFMADFASQVYNYMLQHPSEEVQLMVLFDELAGLVPPTGNPPTKKSIQLLLKQARKYGVSMLLATQNISDVDYKSLGQVGTWALGRMMAKQDIEKVRAIIEAISPADVEEITTKLRKLKTGEFMLLCPDVYKEVQYMQVRWLTTNHTTLDDNKVKKIMDESGLRPKFQKITEEAEKVEERKKGAKEDEKKSGSEPKSHASEPSDDLSALPTIPTLASIPDILKESGDAVSSEVIAAQVGMDEEEVEKELKKMVKSKKLSSDTIENREIYWSSSVKMDPKKNLVGRMFQLSFRIIQGQAEEIAKKHIPKAAFRYFQKIRKVDVKYIPLWRIGYIRDVKRVKGGFFRKKEVWESVEGIHYINGLNSKLVTITGKKKDRKVEFKRSVVDVDEVETLPTDLSFEQISMNDLRKSSHIYPTVNREEAQNLIRQIIGGRINLKVAPSIVWFPVYEFDKYDKDRKMKFVSWVDGILGTHFEEDENPLK